MKIISLLLLVATLDASTTRFLTYNILNYSDDSSREENYISILELIEPNLIVAQEIISQTGYDNFKNHVLEVLEPSSWLGAPFINQTAQQDIALYFKHEDFTYINTNAINTAQSSGTRDVIEWTMMHNQSGIEFNIYGVHLKASSGTSNAVQRLEEVTVLRNHLNNLNPNSKFIVAGDFNIYSNNSNSEPAFDMLTSEGENSQGQLFDPINRIGNWHNNSSFADVHTQSPRTTQFGGGANGGMDDRFDWLFISESMLSTESDVHYMEDTYEVLGNDGNHFNDAINNGNNSAVSNEIANALHSASDHLPVYMDVWFDDLVYGDSSIVISEIMINPSAVSDSYGEWFEVVNMTDMTINLQGWTIKDGDENGHIINNIGNTLLISPGEYIVLSRNNDFSINGGLISDYVYEGISFSNSEDAILLMNVEGEIIDEVQYTNSWPILSGSSIEIHDLNLNNNDNFNWFSATSTYGDGDFGTPGISFNGTLKTDHSMDLPMSFSLSHAYPNPFNPSTMVEIQNSSGKNLKLEIFNLNGYLIKSVENRWTSLGAYNFTWDAKKEANGVYFFRLSDVNNSIIRKVVLLK
ncbi:lamin tail domain-containing protein [Candidatus Marinimicrobia bacterium]|nr:lamin tail domain-containing protein [Candidatus Neomarinimicrobiota bacterium]